ncbi:MAG: YncE family protein [Bradyrhizobium sp.]|uniref:YncE family protein n=1 Tax=Bradyrhizobium sp. TaxID=376 RepID=UPI003D0A619B
MSQNTPNARSFALGYYAGNRKTGSVSVIRRENGQTRLDPLAVDAETGLAAELKPIFVGLTEDRRVILLDPKSKQIRLAAGFTADAFPAHIYSDPNSDRDWFMNDGDKETGNDRLNCGDQGSSVTVVEKTASAQAKFLKTVCVGRGHHQAAFTYPSAQAPKVPHRAYISSLKDGTLTAIGNDPNDAATYLKAIATINLCETDKEQGMAEPAVPNNAFPHGLAYSPLTGKLYNLNNGYGNVAVIDPASNRIEARFPFKGHSNLFMTPGGRYIIGRGADRKSDPNHVIARLTVLDVTDNRIVDTLELPDIYISKYYFNPEGSKLYLTTSSSGSPEQQANIKADALLVLDLTALPKLKLTRELRLGTSSGSLAFLQAGGSTALVFSSHGEGGAVAVIDGARDEQIETLAVPGGMSHSRVWIL